MADKQIHYSFKRISKEHEQRGRFADNIEDAMEQTNQAKGQLECGYLGRIASSLEQIQRTLQFVCTPLVMQARDAQDDYIAECWRAWREWLDAQEVLHGKCPTIVVIALRRNFDNMFIYTARRLALFWCVVPGVCHNGQWIPPRREVFATGWAKRNQYPRWMSTRTSKTRSEYDKWRKRKARKKPQPRKK